MTASPAPVPPRANGRFAVLSRVAFGAAIALYPLVVWYALSHGSARTTALVVLAFTLPIAIVRLRSLRAASLRSLAVLPFVTLLTLGIGAALNSTGFVLAVPTAVNAVLLIAFGATLRRGSVPMIERFARIQLADPTREQIRWCRAWTWIWCAFFIANGTTAAALAAWAPLSWWAAYSGGLAYAAIGALLAIEWALRRRRFGRA